jgi:hypothetical protein
MHHITGVTNNQKCLKQVVQTVVLWCEEEDEPEWEHRFNPQEYLTTEAYLSRAHATEWKLVAPIIPASSE